ncbi:MAG: TlpA family protein disulfide reductase [Archangiaceae bacterium]|nr:TlpA family protein disulfide reductase [Archangiaceae bacterium]
MTSRLLTVLLLLAAGCESGRAVKVPVPDDFRAFTLTDDVLDARALAGRPWVISVWRPGCASCMRQLHALDQVKKRWEPKGVGFVALSVETDPQRVFDAAAQAEVDSQLAYSDAAMGPLGLRSLPSTVFVDSRSTIVAVLGAEGDEQALEKWLKVAQP